MEELKFHVFFLDFNFRFNTASSENMVPKQKNEMEKAGQYN